ncbi:MAG: hypothetical protein IJB55_06530 [Firmicutes bacterium]|nr:hypothetical protein [Bacillota bacterium]
MRKVMVWLMCWLLVCMSAGCAEAEVSRESMLAAINDSYGCEVTVLRESSAGDYDFFLIEIPEEYYGRVLGQHDKGLNLMMFRDGELQSSAGRGAVSVSGIFQPGIHCNWQSNEDGMTLLTVWGENWLTQQQSYSMTLPMKNAPGVQDLTAEDMVSVITVQPEGQYSDMKIERDIAGLDYVLDVYMFDARAYHLVPQDTYYGDGTLW